MRFYLETYGCTANHGNSQEFSAALLEMGHHLSPINEADLVVINTCAVTGRTERQIISRLRLLEGDRLVIGGCLPEAIPEAIVDIQHRESVGILSSRVAREIVESLPSSQSPGPDRNRVEERDHLCGIVNISEGCMGECSYCIVRNARGGLVSRSPDEIAESVRALLGSGIVEIQLASQDTSAYGRDIESSIPSLLRKITEISGRYMIRMGMMNPATIGPILGDLLDSFHDDKIYRFLHIPVQSGSDRVLDAMNRGYSVEDFEHIVDCFREEFSDLTLTTDVIAGFPGETEEDFNATANLMRRIEADKVNITRFSRRPHTSAWEMKDMPDRFKKARSRILTRIWHDTALSRNRPHLGRSLPALVTERGLGMTMKARSKSYRGIVIRGSPDLGSQQMVKIVGYNPFYLRGIVEK